MITYVIDEEDDDNNNYKIEFVRTNRNWVILDEGINEWYLDFHWWNKNHDMFWTQNEWEWTILIKNNVWITVWMYSVKKLLHDWVSHCDEYENLYFDNYLIWKRNNELNNNNEWSINNNINEWSVNDDCEW